MRRPIPIGLLLVAGFAGALAGSRGQAQQPAVETQQRAVETGPSEGFVLLRNGNVLRGTISPAEGGDLVAIEGGRLLVRDVEV